MFLVYVHLHSIAEGITVGAEVTQGQFLGTVGEDDATYPHLHIEFRKGSSAEKSSVHPLGYLPYTDTANFSAPVLRSFQSTRYDYGGATTLRGKQQARRRFAAG